MNREDNFVVKSDYHLNERNVFSGRFFYANSLQTEEDTSPIRPEWLSIANTKVQVMGVNWTWTPTSSWVNEVRFGYNRYWQNDNVGDYTKSAADYGLNTGVTDSRLFGLPSIEIGSLFVMGGNSSWPLFTAPTRTYQVVDNASLTHGKHNFKFGAEFRRGGSDVFRARRGRGRLVFDDTRDPDSGDVTTPALVNFLQGNFGDEGFGQILTGDIGRNVNMSAVGAFFADDWRIAPRLTLNLGLRYDLTFPIKDENNLIASFNPDQGGLIQVGKGLDSPYATDWNNISPRIGMAWDIFGTGRTVLRAGGALIYEQPTIREFIDRGGLNENPSGLEGVTPGNGNITLVQREIDDTTVLHDAWVNGTPLFASAIGSACASDAPSTFSASLITSRRLMWPPGTSTCSSSWAILRLCKSPMLRTAGLNFSATGTSINPIQWRALTATTTGTTAIMAAGRIRALCSRASPGPAMSLNWKIWDLRSTTGYKLR